jgi:large-conductance mechanosensitive channel
MRSRRGSLRPEGDEGEDYRVKVPVHCDADADLSYPVSVFPIGDFITAVVSFLLVAGAVYFFVVTPINALIARTRKDPAPADPTTKKCPECLSEIPIDARRCMHCAQPVMGKAA